MSLDKSNSHPSTISLAVPNYFHIDADCLAPKPVSFILMEIPRAPFNKFNSQISFDEFPAKWARIVFIF